MSKNADYSRAFNLCTDVSALELQISIVSYYPRGYWPEMGQVFGRNNFRAETPALSPKVSALNLRLIQNPLSNGPIIQTSIIKVLEIIPTALRGSKPPQRGEFRPDKVNYARV